jgi:hypothetical protein
MSTMVSKLFNCNTHQDSCASSNNLQHNSSPVMEAHPVLKDKDMEKEQTKLANTLRWRNCVPQATKNSRKRIWNMVKQ